MPSIWNCEVRQRGTVGSTTFLILPFDPVQEFGSKRAPVVVTINDYGFASRVQMYDGVPHVTLRREHREAVGVQPGDVVACTIEVNEDPDDVDIPTELAAALDAWPEARQAFTRLAPSHQREHARYVADAKQSATRVRRAQKTLENWREWKSPNR